MFAWYTVEGERNGRSSSLVVQCDGADEAVRRAEATGLRLGVARSYSCNLDERLPVLRNDEGYETFERTRSKRVVCRVVNLLPGSVGAR